MAAKTAKAKKPKEDKAASHDDDIAIEVLSSLRVGSGDDAAMFLGSDVMALRIRGVISTQCPTLDDAIGRGGIPLARLTILHGGEGGGKTTLALHLVAECQRMGGVAIYIDKEHKLDPDYAAGIGVDINRMIISQSGTLEEVIEMIFKAIRAAAAHRTRTGKRVPIILVLDSINACVPECVLKGEVGDAHVAPEARLWSRNMSQIIEVCAKEDVALVFISQVRKKIGIMFGDPDTIAGGEAPRFYASLILRIVRVGKDRDSDDDDEEKKGGDVTGSKVEVECKKNQIAPPFRKAQFTIRYGSGIDFRQSLVLLALKYGVLKKDKGHLITYNDGVVGKGMKGAMAFVNDPENAWFTKEINDALRAARGWTAAELPETAPGELEPDDEAELDAEEVEA